MSAIPCYCDRTFEVEVELVPDSHLIFRGERIVRPAGQNVLFPRIAPDGSRFAGIGHQDGKCWEWDGGAWHDRGPTHGVQSIIYDASGQLHVVRGPGEPEGSQGWRYVADDGRLVPSWETYDPTTPFARSLGVDHLWEWTPLGDVIIGQGGDEGGMQALVRGRRVLLAEGDCRFIHAYRRGDVFAIALVRNGAASFPMFTLNELLAMPTYAAPGSTPFPPPPEPEPEIPMPEPVPVPDLRELVEAHWRAHDMDRKQVEAWNAGKKPAIQRKQMQWFARLTPVVQHALPAGWQAKWEKYRNPVPGTAWFWLPDQFLLVDPNDIVHSVKVIAGAGEAIHREHDAYEIDEHGERRYKWIFGVPGWSDQGIPTKDNYTVSDPVADPIGAEFFGPFDAGGDDGDPGDETDDPPKPPTTPEPCTECVGLKAKVEELEELLLDMAKAADARFLKLEDKPAPEVVLPELVARGKVYGLKIELPVVKK